LEGSPFSGTMKTSGLKLMWVHVFKRKERRKEGKERNSSLTVFRGLSVSGFLF